MGGKHTHVVEKERKEYTCCVGWPPPPLIPEVIITMYSYNNGWIRMNVH